jgi:HPt (histidine-containing phosphotransfer) domain-containing protein
MEAVHINADQALDYERVEEATGGDPEFVRELMDLFMEDARERVEELRSAVTGQDADAVARSAHKLKGSSSNVGAMRVSELAKILEDRGRAGDVSGTAPMVTQVELELAKVGPAIDHLLDV